MPSVDENLTACPFSKMLNNIDDSDETGLIISSMLFTQHYRIATAYQMNFSREDDPWLGASLQYAACERISRRVAALS